MRMFFFLIFSLEKAKEKLESNQVLDRIEKKKKKKKKSEKGVEEKKKRFRNEGGEVEHKGEKESME